MMTREEVWEILTSIRTELVYFLIGHDREPPGLDSLPKNIDDVNDIYVNNSEYLMSCTSFHFSDDMIDFHMKLEGAIGIDDSVIDVGCESGITGLLLAHSDRKVTFFDYDSIGLWFIRWYLDKMHLPGETRIYSSDMPKHDYALALDVIEHSGDSLAFLRWMETLGKKVFITYPLTVGWQPTYLPTRIDEYVDDDAVRLICHARYSVFLDERVDDRRFLGYST